MTTMPRIRPPITYSSRTSRASSGVAYDSTRNQVSPSGECLATWKSIRSAGSSSPAKAARKRSIGARTSVSLAMAAP